VADHLSSLVLDTLVAGFPIEPEAQTHVDGCAQCSAAVAVRRKGAARVLEHPEARRRLGLLQSKVVLAAERPARAWWVTALAIAVPVALAVVVITRAVDPTGERIKGAAVLQVLLEGAPVSRAAVGSRVTLALGSAGAAYGAVLSVDAQGEVDIVWPAKGETSARLAGGASETLAQFEVTPGSLTLHARLSDAPLPLDQLMRELREAKGEAPRGPWVSTRLEVTP